MMDEKKFSYILGAALIVALLVVAYIGSRLQQAETELDDIYQRLGVLEQSQMTLLNSGLEKEDFYFANLPFDTGEGAALFLEAVSSE